MNSVHERKPYAAPHLRAGWLPLLVTQTLGAINDNMFKNALVVLIMFHAAHQGAGALVALAGGLFILPFMLLSATAGELADRFGEASADLSCW